MKRLSVIFTICALVSGSPLLAQDVAAAPKVIQPQPAMIAAMRAFASCVVHNDPKGAFAFLKNGQFATPNNPHVRSLVAANRRCLSSGTLSFNQVWFAGAAAEAIYRNDGFRFADYPISNSAIGALRDLRSNAVLQGTCVAWSQPREVDALFATEAGSAGEARAITALGGSVQTCMKEKAQFPVAIRSVVAAGSFPAVAPAIKALAQ